jgi:hypothetical protein
VVMAKWIKFEVCAELLFFLRNEGSVDVRVLVRLP